MRCKPSVRGAKEFYEIHVDDYLPTRDEAFKEFASDKLDELLDEFLSTVDEDTTPTLMDFFYWLEEEEVLVEDDFTFKSRDEWVGDEYEGMLGDCADQAYGEYRDRQMGL